MQEMDPPRIADYFNDLRTISGSRQLFLLLQPRRKKIAGWNNYSCKGLSLAYRRSSFIDELCPWHQFYYTKKPPFYHPYPPIRHKLVNLSS